LLELRRFGFLGRERAGHGRLSLPVHLPGELVKAIVEVVGLVSTGKSPWLRVLREVGVDVGLGDGLADGWVDWVGIDVNCGGAHFGITGSWLLWCGRGDGS